MVRVNSWDWNTSRENRPHTKGAGIFKPKGQFVYLQEALNAYQGYDFKIGIQAGSIPQKMEHRGETQCLASSPNNGFIYALRGYDIFRLRPNQATDLFVGTIPNSTETPDGEFIEIYQPSDLWVNGDASVFYVVAGIKSDTRRDDSVYKLTFD